jgi:hypothetical protein
VVGGNILLGAPALRVALPGSSPGAGQTGYVSTLYLSTGQSLVQLDGGTLLLVGSLGRLGSPVAVDGLSGQVTGLSTGALDPLVTGNGISLAGAGPASRDPLIGSPSLRGIARTTGAPATVAPGSLPGASLPVGTGDPLGRLCC